MHQKSTTYQSARSPIKNFGLYSESCTNRFRARCRAARYGDSCLLTTWKGIDIDRRHRFLQFSYLLEYSKLAFMKTGVGDGPYEITPDRCLTSHTTSRSGFSLGITLLHSEPLCIHLCHGHTSITVSAHHVLVSQLGRIEQAASLRNLVTMRLKPLHDCVYPIAEAACGDRPSLMLSRPLLNS